MDLSILSADKVIFQGSVDMAILPGSEGQFGVLDRHAPLLAPLKEGQVMLYTDGQLQALYTITGGFADITPERCVVLVDGIRESGE